MICVKCCITMVPDKTGIQVAEMFDMSDEIYKIFSADTVRCESCNSVVISSLAKEPLCEHFQDELMARYSDSIEIKFWNSERMKPTNVIFTCAECGYNKIKAEIFSATIICDIDLGGEEPSVKNVKDWIGGDIYEYHCARCRNHIADNLEDLIGVLK